MNTMEKLEYEINKAVDTSCICKGKTCRSLESEIDALESRLSSLCMSEGTCSSDSVLELEKKISTAYKQIPSKTNI